MPEGSDSSEFSGNELRQLLRHLKSPTGAGGRYPVDPEIDREIREMVGIIDSMTTEERLHPAQITEEGRRRRIAGGAGVSLNLVGEFVKQFDGMSQVMREIRRIRGR